MIKVSKITFLKGDRVKILFSQTSKITKRFYESLFSKLKLEGQIISLDPKRSWNVESFQENFRIFRPSDLNDFVRTISNLKKYVSPRLNSIIISDFHYFLRDYRGKSAKNVVINNRVLAICLSLLTKLAETGVNVIVLTYENPLRRSYPLSNKIFKYYNCDIYQIESFTNNQFKLKLNI